VTDLKGNQLFCEENSDENPSFPE